MSVINQKTIKRDITFKGVGLHSGANVTMTVKEAKQNSGMSFKRVDIRENNIVVTNIFNVSSAVFCTTIANESGVSISTIEHLMGALYGLGIDNALIEIDNQEVPILDGSAKLFIEEISKAGNQQVKLWDLIKILVWLMQKAKLLLQTLYQQKV